MPLRLKRAGPHASKIAIRSCRWRSQHEGEQYQVERLDFENHKAYVRKVEPDYFTTAMTYTRVEVLEARINHLAGEELALPYHGSLSRERRLALEQSLNAASVRIERVGSLVNTCREERAVD